MMRLMSIVAVLLLTASAVMGQQCKQRPDGSWDCNNGGTVVEAGPLVPVQRPQSVTPPPYVVRVQNTVGNGSHLGTGTLIYRNDRCGVVMTCDHIFSEGVGPIAVHFPDGMVLEGKLLARDSKRDLSAIQIARPDAPPAVVASAYPRAGEIVTRGGYGTTGRYQEAQGQVRGYMGTKTNPERINMMFGCTSRQGDSGGPVFNSRRELVGVVWGSDRTESAATSAVAVKHLCESDRYAFPWNADVAKTRIQEQERTKREGMQQQAPEVYYPPATSVDNEARTIAGQALEAAQQAHSRLDDLSGIEGDISAVRNEVKGLPEKIDAVEKGLLARLHERVHEGILGFLQSYGIVGAGGLGAILYFLYRKIKQDVSDLVTSKGENKLAIQHIAEKTPWDADDKVADKVAERLLRRLGSEQGPLKESVAMAKEDFATLSDKLGSLTSQVKALADRQTSVQ